MSKYLSWYHYGRFFRARAPALVAPFIGPWERPKIEHYGRQPLKYPPIFMIGPPRTGSTISYQTFSNLFDVAYCTSLVDLLYRNFFFGFVMSDALYGSGAHNIMESRYGKANRFSPRMPTEAGYLWGRWLPRDKHFMAADDVSAEKKSEIRRDITSISNYLEKPLIFKNLLIGQRLRLIHEIFPEAKLILLSRDQVYTTQSILQGRQTFGVPEHQMWSIRPPEFEQLERLDEIEMVVHQVFSIDRQMRQDSELFDNANVLEVSYESLALLDEKMVRDWSEFLGVRCRKDYKIYVPSVRNKQNVDDETFQRIRSAVQEAGKQQAAPASV